MDWELQIAFHFPHNRFLLGWEFIEKNEKYNYTTINVYLFIVTFNLDIWH
jgi:hypothetical protein